jgi:DNA replication and repair protein RecF
MLEWQRARLSASGAPPASSRIILNTAPAARPSANVWLEHIAIRDFRNIERVDTELPAEGTVLLGENGHGKTNFLEAIYYFHLLRSVRGARDTDVVRFDAAGFHLAAGASVHGAPRRIAVGFERAGRRKKVTLDGAETRRLMEGLGSLPSVLFSPRDLQLIAGSPAERRRYLDITLGLTSRRYLGALQGYRAALSRRNVALRDAARGSHGGDDLVAVWEPALAKHGAEIWRERIEWVEKVSARFSELCAAMGELSDVRMRYSSAVPRSDDLEGALRDALAARRTRDIKRLATHAGPHRDELEIQLGGRGLGEFGSAGQQRTASIALRILEAETLRERSGGEPLLLLDDPFAELDARRAVRILELLGRSAAGQTILAVPKASDIPPGMFRLERRHIVDGRLSEASR